MMELSEAGLARRVACALQDRWPGVQAGEIERLQGGASGLTYRVVLSCAPVTEVVIKVAPPGLAPVRNRDVLRQARLLTVLGRCADVRVPAVYACDRGDPPGCPPLFVMSFEPGASDEPLHSAGEAPSADVRARGLRAATMLAALHRVPVPVLDEPAVSVRHEVERWARAFETVPAHLRVGAAETTARLLSALPPECGPAVCHGDWRLGNMLCVGAEIVAVIDWEIWSVGDPRADLAWFLLMCDPSHPAAIAGPEAGLPSVSELVLAYSAAVGGPVPDLSWFRALAAFKQAAVTALLAKHATRRELPMEKVTARLATLLPDLQEFACGFLEQKGGAS
jgi:aminoglycoside phosphotransferase (APT) family kinase protein